MDANAIMSLKVTELKEKLSELNLPTTGKKIKLQERLLIHLGLINHEDTEDEEGDDTIIESKQVEEEKSTDEEVDTNEETDIEIKRKEIGCRENYTYDNRADRIFTLRDIRESLSTFDGINQPSIEKWLEEFEENAITVKWDNIQKFIYAKQLIKGTAKSYIRSQPCITNWRKLRESLSNEFGSKISAADIHKILQNKLKKFNESCLEYLYSLMEIGAKIDLDEKSIIEYFIDGIPDTTNNKYILYEANTISDLKNKIRIYEKIKIKSGQKIQPGNTNNNKIKKCDFCPNLKNHYTTECKKSKNLCTRCNQKGHWASHCQNNQSSSYKQNKEQATSSSTQNYPPKSDKN